MSPERREAPPLGALHGGGGLWGTLAVGLFHETNGLFFGGGIRQLGLQALGAGAVFAFSLVACLVIFAAIKATVGLRVSRQEELTGLDAKHGVQAYPDFRPVPAHSLMGDD